MYGERLGLLFGVNKKLLTQHTSGPITVLHWLGLGLDIRVRARARVRARVRARARGSGFTISHFGTIYTKHRPRLELDDDRQ